MSVRTSWVAGLFLLPLSAIAVAAETQSIPEPKLSAEVRALSANGPLRLSDAIDLALRDNPGLAAMQSRARAAAAVPGQVSVLPDPRLSLNAANLPVDTFSFTQEGMTQLQVGVVQALPAPGKLALRESAAEFDSAAAFDDVDEMRLQLARDVRRAWWGLFYFDRALDILDRNADLLRQLVEVAQTKYRVGQGLQQDVLLAQLELSRLKDQEIVLLGQRRSEEARLNVLLNLPSDHDIRLPAVVVPNLAEPADEAVLLEKALQLRPVLAARNNAIEAARVRLDLARKDRSPDFSLGASYGLRQGQNNDGSDRADFLSVMFNMSMPIFTGQRQDKSAEQRGSQVQQQMYNLADARQRVRGEVSRALADYRSAREQASLLLAGILPQARQTVASMLAAYQVDKVDFLNVVRVQVTLFNYETRYWNAIARANQAQAALAAAVGLSLADEAQLNAPSTKLPPLSEVPHE